VTKLWTNLPPSHYQLFYTQPSLKERGSPFGLPLSFKIAFLKCTKDWIKQAIAWWPGGSHQGGTWLTLSHEASPPTMPSQPDKGDPGVRASVGIQGCTETHTSVMTTNHLT
jgi:hypothetical protein